MTGELIQHRYLHRTPLADYAAQIGRTTGSLKVTLFRLRSRLQKCILHQLNLATSKNGGTSGMNADERSQLIDALVEGEISEADFVRLEAEMLVDPEVRREYYDRVELDSLIDVEIRDRTAEPTTEKVVAFPNRRLPLPWIAGIAAAIACAALVGWFTRTYQPFDRCAGHGRTRCQRLRRRRRARRGKMVRR